MAVCAPIPARENPIATTVTVGLARSALRGSLNPVTWTPGLVGEGPQPIGVRVGL